MLLKALSYVQGGNFDNRDQRILITLRVRWNPERYRFSNWILFTMGRNQLALKVTRVCKREKQAKDLSLIR